MLKRPASSLNFQMKFRTALILVFISSFLGLAHFVAISYRYFIKIEEKLKFVEGADDALELFLEARRFEKNYLLYHQESSFQKSIRFLNQFENSLIGNRQEIIKITGMGQWQKFLVNLRDYRISLMNIYDMRTSKENESGSDGQRNIENLIRRSNQQITVFYEGIVDSERALIKGLFESYQILCIIFSFAIVAGGIFIVYLIEKKLVNPLSLIEEATQKITRGDFQPITWKNFNDEIGSLVSAFNRMVLEIQMRQQQLIETKKLSARVLSHPELPMNSITPLATSPLHARSSSKKLTGGAQNTMMSC